jgi:hypothetical protein
MFGFKKKPMTVPQQSQSAAKKELPGFPVTELQKGSEQAGNRENLRPKPIFMILSQDFNETMPKDSIKKLEALESEINGFERVEKKIMSDESLTIEKLDDTIATLKKLRDLIFKLSQKLEKVYLETNFDLEAKINVRNYHRDTAVHREHLPKDILAAQQGLYDSPDNPEERNPHNDNQRNPSDRSPA